MSSHAAPQVPEAPITLDWTLAFQNALTREASAYWTRLKGDRPMPEAAELSVREMKRFIRHVALLDILPGERGEMDFKVRLVGDGLRRHLGDVTGKRFSEFLPPEQQARWRTGVLAVCERKAPLRSAGWVTFLDRQWLDFEALLAPLGSGTDIGTVFAVFVTWTRGEPDRVA